MASAVQTKGNKHRALAFRQDKSGIPETQSCSFKSSAGVGNFVPQVRRKKASYVKESAVPMRSNISFQRKDEKHTLFDAKNQAQHHDSFRDSEQRRSMFDRVEDEPSWCKQGRSRPTIPGGQDPQRSEKREDPDTRFKSSLDRLQRCNEEDHPWFHCIMSMGKRSHETAFGSEKREDPDTRFDAKNQTQHHDFFRDSEQRRSMFDRFEDEPSWCKQGRSRPTIPGGQDPQRSEKREDPDTRFKSSLDRLQRCNEEDHPWFHCIMSMGKRSHETAFG
eukprot:symbB.v1.2.002495.t1/scaffold132.1/size310437/6